MALEVFESLKNLIRYSVFVSVSLLPIPHIPKSTKRKLKIRYLNFDHPYNGISLGLSWHVSKVGISYNDSKVLLFLMLLSLLLLHCQPERKREAENILILCWRKLLRVTRIKRGIQRETFHDSDWTLCGKSDL